MPWAAVIRKPKRGDDVVVQEKMFPGYELIFDPCVSGNSCARLIVLRKVQLTLELPGVRPGKNIAFEVRPANLPSACVL